MEQTQSSWYLFFPRTRPIVESGIVSKHYHERGF